MKLLGLLLLFMVHSQEEVICRTNVSGRLVFPPYATLISHIKVEGIKVTPTYPPCDPDPTMHNSCSKYVFSNVDGAFDFGMVQSGLTYAIVVQVDGMEEVRQYFYVPANPGGSACLPGPGIRVDVLLHPATKAAELAEDAVAIEDLARTIPSKDVVAFEESIDKKSKTSPQEMLANLQEVLNNAPNYYDANLKLGLEYKKDGQKDAAARVLSHALEVNSGSMMARAALGEYSFEAGDFAKTAELLESATRLGNTSADIFYMLGTSYYKLNRLAPAEASLLRALDIAPSIGKTYLQLYNVYMKAKMPNKALEAVQAYLDKYPKAEDRAYVQSMADKLRQALKSPLRN